MSILFDNQLLRAMGTLRPVGIDKHFKMARILKRLEKILELEATKDTPTLTLHTPREEAGTEEEEEEKGEREGGTERIERAQMVWKRMAEWWDMEELDKRVKEKTGVEMSKKCQYYCHGDETEITN